MVKRRAQPYIRTSVNVSPEFHNLCIIHNIKFSEALRTGIAVLLAEKGVKEYDNKLNLYRKMVKYQKELETTLNRLYEIEEGKNIKEIKLGSQEDPSEEADEILKEHTN